MLYSALLSLPSLPLPLPLALLSLLPVALLAKLAVCDTCIILPTTCSPPLQVPPSQVVPLPTWVPDGPLGTVLEKSRRICLTLYGKEEYTPTIYKDVMLR
jgi:hypothetical protein